MILRKEREVYIFKHMLYISALEQATVLILGKYVLLAVIHTICKHCYTEYLSDFVKCRKRINILDHGLYIAALEHVMKLIFWSCVLFVFIN